MHKVEFRYKFMGIDRSRKILVPGCWEELNDRQFSVCARIYTEDMTDADFVQQFMGIPASIMNRITPIELYNLTSLTEFATNPEGITNFFFLKQLPGTKLKSPGNRLSGVTVEHFALFDTAYFDYKNDPITDNLYAFVAMLYIMPGEVITKIDFDKRLKYVKSHVKLSDCHAVFLNYIFIHHWLAKAFPFLFEVKEKPETETKKKVVKTKAVKQFRPDWNSIIDSFIGEDILNYDKYRQMPAIIVFKTINKRIKNTKKNVK